MASAKLGPPNCISRHVLGLSLLVVHTQPQQGLYLYQPERDVLELSVFVGPAPLSIGDVFQPGEGLTKRVWEMGASLIVDDCRHWEGREYLARRITLSPP
jgi:hypothetical protein